MSLSGGAVVSFIPCGLGVRAEHRRMRADRRHATWQQRRGEGKPWCGSLTEVPSRGGRRHGIRAWDISTSATSRDRSVPTPKSRNAAVPRPVSHENQQALRRFRRVALPALARAWMYIGQADVRSYAAAMPKKEKR